MAALAWKATPAIAITISGSGEEIALFALTHTWKHFPSRAIDRAVDS